MIKLLLFWSIIAFNAVPSFVYNIWVHSFNIETHCVYRIMLQFIITDSYVLLRQIRLISAYTVLHDFQIVCHIVNHIDM